MAVRAPESLGSPEHAMQHAVIQYGVPRWSPSWAVPEVPVPEPELHDRAIEYIRALLEAWVARHHKHAKVLRNIGIRWIPSEPLSGFDPDLCLLDPAPEVELEDGDETGLTSLRLWDPTITVPPLAIEIVSPGHPYKDYVDTPDRVAACGIGELWVYDPQLVGPTQGGGPHVLQIWQVEPGCCLRVHAGPGPAYSKTLGAWLHPTASRSPTKARLEISDDHEGQQRWLTASEHERQQRLVAEQHARAAKQHARAAKQHATAEEQRRHEAERELATLRAKLEHSE